MPANSTDLEKRLWASADGLRANSKLKASEYSAPVLGLIFLRFADNRFTRVQQELAPQAAVQGYTLDKTDYQEKGVMFLPEEARYSKLLALPESEDIAGAISGAMKAIEAENEELTGMLPKQYNQLDKSTLIDLLKTFSGITRRYRGRLLRQGLRIFPGQVRHVRGAARRRVLHADLDSQADRRDYRAVSWAYLRPCLWLRRYVCAERGLCRAAPAQSRHRHLRLWAGEDAGHREAVQDEPRGPRPLR